MSGGYYLNSFWLYNVLLTHCSYWLRDAMTLVADILHNILHDAIDNGATSNVPYVVYTDEQGQVFMLFMCRVSCTTSLEMAP